MLNGIAQDIRSGLRVLRREPGYTAVAVLTMALGVGATSTLISVVYGVLLKPLPFPEPERLIRVEETRGGNHGRIPWSISNATYLAWSDQPATIEAIGSFGAVASSMTMTLEGGAERLRAATVSPSVFTVLRVRPALGRLPEEGRGGSASPDVILLGYGIWRDRFGSRTDIVGQPIRIDDRLLTVIGVMPRGFSFPDRDAQAWIPRNVIQLSAEVNGEKVLRVQIFSALARLRPGMTHEQAAAEATARARSAPDLGRAALSLFGSDGDVRIVAAPARDVLTAEVRPAIAILLTAAVLLFATATASGVGIQLARVTTRRHETAIRAAIGAGFGRLVRQSVVETTLMGLLGGVGGLALAGMMHRVLPSILPADFPRLEEVNFDWRIALVCAGLTLVTSLVCALLPATQGRRLNLVESLSEGGASPAGATKRSSAGRLRIAIMAGQVAIASILLVGASLLMRSFAELVRADRGYDPASLLTVSVPLPPKSTFAQYAPLLERVRDRLAGVTGVADVAFGNALPFVTAGGFRGLNLPSPSDGAVQSVQTIERTVSPEYFRALRLRLVAGRTLADSETADSPRVVVVNRSFAARYLGDRPLGRGIPGLNGFDWEVVGVVEDVQQGGLTNGAASTFGGVTDPRQPEIYLSYRQATLAQSVIVLVVRTTIDPMAVAPTLRAIVRDEDPSLAIESMATMDERVLSSLARPRTYALLLGGFAASALIIAGVGLFGVLSYITAQRTREIGLRTALGASPRDIFGLVARQVIGMTAAGVLVGLFSAFLAVQSLSKVLYGVSARDPWSFAAATLVLGAVATIACLVPAWRAARIDPLRALRSA